jgi:hypothetical protein
MKDMVSEVTFASGLRDQFEICDAPTNRYHELMRVYHRGEAGTTSLPGGGFAQQIIIAGEQKPSQFQGAIEQLRIFELGSVVDLGGEHIDASGSQPDGDRTRNVNVQVDGQGHLQLPPRLRSSSRRANGGVGVLRRMSSTSLKRRLISVSNWD